MADLNQLMELQGAVAAFTMNDRGELTEHVIDEASGLNPTALDLLAHMCVANIAIATMQARGWEASSESKGFYPINGFTLVGFDWSAVTNGQEGVVIRNDGADYQKAYDLLGQPGGAV
jgi:roadblock/LC7 domain-containing protein